MSISSSSGDQALQQSHRTSDLDPKAAAELRAQLEAYRSVIEKNEATDLSNEAKASLERFALQTAFPKIKKKDATWNLLKERMPSWPKLLQRPKGKEELRNAIESLAPPVNALAALAENITGMEGVARDMFVARPVDLLRKMLDELTLALHWYVIGRLNAPLLGRMKRVKEDRPLIFKSDADYTSMRNEQDKVFGISTLVKSKKPLEFPGSQAFPSDKFHSELVSYDLAQLLRHIKSNKLFYSSKARKAARELAKLRNSHFHRNYLAVETTNEAILALLPQIAKLMKQMIDKSVVKQFSHPQGVKEAVETHQAAIEKIRKLSETFRPNGMSWEDALERCRFLLSDNQQETKAFLVGAVSSRLFLREDMDDEQDVDEEQRPSQQHYVAKVSADRYHLTDGKVKMESWPVQDPFVATNQDLLNRGLDETLLILAHAISETRESDIQARFLQTKRQKLDEYFLESDQPRKLPLYRKSRTARPTKKSGKQLVDNQMLKDILNLNYQPGKQLGLKAVLRPEVLDPDFLLHFVKVLLDTENAKNLVKLRDVLAHQAYLFLGQELKRRGVEEALEAMLEVCESFRNQAKVVSEYPAMSRLKQLKASIPTHYKRIRGRQSAEWQNDSILEKARANLTTVLNSRRAQTNEVKAVLTMCALHIHPVNAGASENGEFQEPRKTARSATSAKQGSRITEKTSNWGGQFAIFGGLVNGDDDEDEEDDNPASPACTEGGSSKDESEDSEDSEEDSDTSDISDISDYSDSEDIHN